MFEVSSSLSQSQFHATKSVQQVENTDWFCHLEIFVNWERHLQISPDGRTTIIHLPEKRAAPELGKEVWEVSCKIISI